jgi:isovaleryl-CoA dehydrogenase
MLPNSVRAFNFGLGETADMLRDSVAGFAADRIAPLANRVDREDWFPRELWPEMGALGLHGSRCRKSRAGQARLPRHCIAMEEISRASGSVGLSMALIPISA